jgi:hypothetical protein
VSILRQEVVGARRDGTIGEDVVVGARASRMMSGSRSNFPERRSCSASAASSRHSRSFSTISITRWSTSKLSSSMASTRWMSSGRSFFGSNTVEFTPLICRALPVKASQLLWGGTYPYRTVKAESAREMRMGIRSSFLSPVPGGSNRPPDTNRRRTPSKAPFPLASLPRTHGCA